MIKNEIIVVMKNLLSDISSDDVNAAKKHLTWDSAVAIEEVDDDNEIVKS